MNIKIISALSIMVFPGVIHAEELFGDEDDLGLYDEDLISIATGYDKPISKAPAVATVITANDIKKIGATDLDDILETVPGLHVARDSIGYNPIYSFRGIYSSLNPQVLMLVNGVPFKSLFQGDRHLVWAGYPVENISRIEIIRGPGSAVYGADAFAGVINIITKQGDEVSGVKSGIRAGSFDTTEAWLTTGGSDGDFKYLFNLEYEKTDGQRELIDVDAQTLLDFVDGTGASLAPGPVNLGREAYDASVDLGWKEWRLQANIQRRESQTGAGVAQALDPNGLGGSDRYGISLSYKQPELVKDFQVEAMASFRSTSQEVEQNLMLFPAGSTGGLPLGPFPDGVIGNPEIFERHFHVDVSALYTGFAKHELRVGSGYYLGDMYKITDERNFGFDPNNPGFPILPGSPLVDATDTPFAFITEGDRSNKYLFVQDAWQFDNDWELTAGIRYDDYSDFGSTINPRLALVWSTSHNLTTKLLYGEAFRAPSFAQTRAINNPSILGNPNLTPEELKSYELAFDYRPTYDLHIDANLFYYRWDDIILFEPDPAGRRAQNAGEQTGYGMELNVVWEASNTLQLSGNLSVVDTTDERTNTDAGNAPEKQLYLRADWQLQEQWSIDLQANWVMNRQRVVVDMRPDIGDYLIFNSTLRYTPNGSNWEFALIAKNLFDEEAREPSPAGDITAGIPAFIPNDLPLAGRAVFGELRFRFDR